MILLLLVFTENSLYLKESTPRYSYRGVGFLLRQQKQLHSPLYVKYN